MFTGLIQAIGRVESATPRGGGRSLGIDVSGLDEEPLPGASVAIDGVCLTVAEVARGAARFDAVAETIERSTLGALRPGDVVNLEPALRLGDRLDGHLVLGHVDAVGTLAEIARLPESRVFRFSMPRALAPLVAQKGSIAVAGVSLTVVEASAEAFSVSVIPQTLRRTILGTMTAGAKVNLEADVLARYVARQRATGAPDAPGLTREQLEQF